MNEYNVKFFRFFPKKYQCFDCSHFKCVAVPGGCRHGFFYKCFCACGVFDTFVSTDMSLCPCLDFEKCFDFLQKSS